MDASSQLEFPRIDQALKEKGQRGHVYLPPTGPLIITTAEGLAEGPQSSDRDRRATRYGWR